VYVFAVLLQCMMVTARSADPGEVTEQVCYTGVSWQCYMWQMSSQRVIR